MTRLSTLLDINDLGALYATKVSPSLTGTPVTVTPPTADNSFQIANTAWCNANLASLSTLSNYVTSSNLATDLALYTTTANLNATLNNYVLSSTLTSTLSSYITQSQLTTSLAPYVTSSTFNSTLSGYVTTAALLADLANLPTLNSLSNYVTIASLNSTLSSYATQSWVQSQGYLTSAGLSSYITQSQLSTDLAAYATISSLGSYVTSSTLASDLAAYATISSLGTYITASQLTTDLAPYALTSSLSAYETTSALTTTLASYATQSWVTSQLTANSGLGIGQTWQTQSRTFGTTYYNTTGKPIVVSITGYLDSLIPAMISFQLVVGGLVVATPGFSNLSQGYGYEIYFTVEAIVPAGASYTTGTQSGYTVPISGWVELR